MKKQYIIYAGILAIGIAIGYLMSTSQNISKSNHQQIESSDHQQITEWTCSMHPQIRRDEPGQCPICGMDLVKASSIDNDDSNPLAVKMSPTAIQLADVQTSIVEKSSPVKTLNLDGKVQENESTVATQVTHIGGRIEQLIVNTEGEQVTKGQVVAYVYSPELVTAQEELLEAQKMKDSNPTLFEAANNKLKNWKLTDRQIDKILTSGKPTERFPILADVNGIVTQKKVNVGDYVKQGAPLLEVADLSTVWVLFDVYEQDLSWIKPGDEITYHTSAIPGKSFTGKVSFIDPVINSKTRVVQARIVASNKSRQLKPEMFVKGTLKSPLNKNENQIIIPKSAILWTGEKSVIFIKTSDDNGLGFEMRQVNLGPALGYSYVIEEGLKPGEEIAIHGAFSIDAAAQLAGKPSMMNQPEGDLEELVSQEALAHLETLNSNYLALKNSLVNDNFKEAKTQGMQLKKTLANIDMKDFKEGAHMAWMDIQPTLKNSLEHAHHWQSIEDIRKAFISISNKMIELNDKFNINKQQLYVQQCPMANEDKGADWLSTEEEVRNPYFGASMMKCGSVKKTIK